MPSRALPAPPLPCYFPWLTRLFVCLYLQGEDTIETDAKETSRLKDIPVPVSVAQKRVEGLNKFNLPSEHIRAPAPWVMPKCNGAEVLAGDPVDWDMDPAAFRFLSAMNRGEKGYAGPAVEEGIFEKLIDRFEKSVKADVMPELATLKQQLGGIAPDPSALDAAFEWWVQRRKQLAMPLIRGLRPPPDPEDPDTTGVAFRPREKEGVRRMRSNNKKVRRKARRVAECARACMRAARARLARVSSARLLTSRALVGRPHRPHRHTLPSPPPPYVSCAQTYNLMASLHDEFSRLTQLCELIKRRERLKLDHHQTSGEYVEAAHRHLLHRLHRQRTGQGGWKDDLEDERPAVSHKKGASAAMAAMAAPRAAGADPNAMGGGRSSAERSHKKRHGGPGRPPKDGVPVAATGSGGGGRERDRNRERDRHRERNRAAAAAAGPPGYVPGAYLRATDDGEVAPTYEDVDSEEEAFNQLTLTVDTQRRDELAALHLPKHLRDLRPIAEDEPTLPAAETQPTTAAGAGALAGAVAALDAPPPALATAAAAAASASLAASAFSAAAAWSGGGGGSGLGAAAAAAASAGAFGASPFGFGGGVPAATATPAAPVPAAAVAPSAAAAMALRAATAADVDEERPAPRVLVGRLRVGRGGRVFIDRGGRGSGPRYGRGSCWRTVGLTSNGHVAGAVAAGASGGHPSQPAPAAASASAPAGDVGRFRLGEQALSQILQSGRICAPHLLDQGVDPDAAWRRNEPLPIRHGPLLFDFSWLPKPQLVPSKAEEEAAAADGAPLVGKKRKAADEPAANGV